MARLRGEALTFSETCAVGHRTAGPNRSFIEMRQELRTDDSAKREVHRQHEASHSDAYSYPAVIDGLPDRSAVPLNQKIHHWVVPFLDSLAEQPTAQDRCDKDRVGHGAEKSERYGPGHGLE